MDCTVSGASADVQNKRGSILWEQNTHNYQVVLNKVWRGIDYNLFYTWYISRRKVANIPVEVSVVTDAMLTLNVSRFGVSGKKRRGNNPTSFSLAFA